MCMQVSFTDMNNYSDEKYNYKNKYEKFLLEKTRPSLHSLRHMFTVNHTL